MVSNIGTWIARIAQDWLVLSLTGSSLAVGLTTALQFVPVIGGSLYGGLIVDRYPRQNILIDTQVVMAALSAMLAVVCLTDVVTAWQVYVVAFVLGCVSVFDTPARQAFVTEMVGRDRVQNAVSLDAAAFQSSRLIGPAIAGALIAGFGPGWAFLLNALSFVGMLGALLAIRDADLHTTPPRPRAKGQIREGLRYVRARPALSATIGLVAVIGACAYNFQVWLTSFTVTVFDGNAGRYGLLNTFIAIGSVAGAIAGTLRTRSRVRLVVGAACLFGAFEVITAMSPSVWLFSALLFPVGFFGITFNTSAVAAVQTATPPELRGRVMSLYSLAFLGGAPLGGVVFGQVTDVLGARTSLTAGGAITALAAVAAASILWRGAVRSSRT